MSEPGVVRVVLAGLRVGSRMGPLGERARLGMKRIMGLRRGCVARGELEWSGGPCTFGGHSGEAESETTWEGQRGVSVAERLKGSDRQDVLAEKEEARLQAGAGETGALCVDSRARNSVRVRVARGLGLEI